MLAHIITAAVLLVWADVSHAYELSNGKVERSIEVDHGRRCSEIAWALAPRPHDYEHFASGIRRLCDSLQQAWEEPHRALTLDDKTLHVVFKGDPRPALPTAVLPALLALPDLLPPVAIGGLRLEHLRIEGRLALMNADLSKLAFENVEFDEVFFARNKFHTLEFVKSKFNGLFQLRNNHANNMGVYYNKFHRSRDINNNQTANSMIIIGNQLKPEPGFDPEIANNVIQNWFVWRPISVDPDISRLNFSSNEIGRIALLWLPKDASDQAKWSGTVDLSGTKVGHRLEVALAENEKQCIPAWAISRDALGKSSMHTRDSVTINLTNVSTNILTWWLPMTGRYRWHGTGLSFGYWGFPEALSPTYFQNLKERCRLGAAVQPPIEEAIFSMNALAQEDTRLNRRDPTSNEENIDALKNDGFLDAVIRWKQLLPEDDSPESIAMIASYLDGNGRFNDARELLYEAKAIDYAVKDCRFPTLPLYKESCVRQVFLKFFLAPTGYGVKPELGVFWMFLVWLIFGAGYKGYSAHRRATEGKRPALLFAPWVRRIMPQTRYRLQLGRHQLMSLLHYIQLRFRNSWHSVSGTYPGVGQPTYAGWAEPEPPEFETFPEDSQEPE